MKHFKKQDLDALTNRVRARLINSVSGYKPANLIGTVSSTGSTNLAVFSSVVHLGANPPLLGFILRSAGDVPRHTYDNIKRTGWYTINHVHETFVEKAHFTSAKFPPEISEFTQCRLKEQWLEGFAAPFVEQSKIKLGMKFVQEIPLEINRTILVIGEIIHLFLPEDVLLPGGNIDLNGVGDVCISGLDTYHRVEKIATYPYAEVSNLPVFDE
jgi:flavin reductase (DIM6/NTAB) family NADH-FMN oxidoreductase RutF